jgi:hypothetical protein
MSEISVEELSDKMVGSLAVARTPLGDKLLGGKYSCTDLSLFVISYLEGFAIQAVTTIMPNMRELPKLLKLIEEKLKT